MNDVNLGTILLWLKDLAKEDQAAAVLVICRWYEGVTSSETRWREKEAESELRLAMGGVAGRIGPAGVVKQRGRKA